MRKILFSLLILSMYTSCDDPVLSPKPRGFPKIDFPEKVYQRFDASYCQFTFEYPQYARIEQDTSYFDEKPLDPCWFNIYVPLFDSRIHCSYYPLKSQADLDELKKDAYELVGKHNIKADFIDELPVEKPDGTTGMVFNIEGPVASPFQFYLTDSKKNFVRGALYFNTQSRPDSLAPLYDFLKTDIMKMINTLEWND